MIFSDNEKEHHLYCDKRSIVFVIDNRKLLGNVLRKYRKLTGLCIIFIVHRRYGNPPLSFKGKQRLYKTITLFFCFNCHRFNFEYVVILRCYNVRLGYSHRGCASNPILRANIRSHFFNIFRFYITHICFTWNGRLVFSKKEREGMIKTILLCQKKSEYFDFS